MNDSSNDLRPWPDGAATVSTVVVGGGPGLDACRSALDTVWDARRLSHRVTVFEADPTAAAVLRRELRRSAALAEVEVVETSPVAAATFTVAAGERLHRHGAVNLLRRRRPPNGHDPSPVGPIERSCPVCPICGAEAGFAPLPDCFVSDPAAAGFSHPIDGWELLEVDSYACRSCGGSDRDRLLWLYLDQELPGAAPAEVGGVEVEMVEIAPSRVLGPRLRARLGHGYRSADLLMAGVDDVVDLCDLPYPDGGFDWLLCSHVLEHVPDDRLAMAEIRRVLRADGRAVLLVPISMIAGEVDEDPALTDPAARLARFGQDDHVRLYNRAGFVQRLEEAGLRVEIVTVDRFGPDAAARHALPATGALYVVRP